jgi:hypothetical protein
MKTWLQRIWESGGYDGWVMEGYAEPSNQLMMAFKL